MNLKFRKGKPCFAHQLQIIQIVLKSFRMFQTSPNEVRILCFYCRLQNREHWLLFATNYLFLAAEINDQCDRNKIRGIVMFFADKNVCNGTLAHEIKLGSTSSIFMLGQLIHIACGLKIKFKTRGNTSWHGI